MTNIIITVPASDSETTIRVEVPEGVVVRVDPEPPTEPMIGVIG